MTTEHTTGATKAASGIIKQWPSILASEPKYSNWTTKEVKSKIAAIIDHETGLPEVLRALAIAREYFCHHRTAKEQKIYDILYEVATKYEGKE